MLRAGSFPSSQSGSSGGDVVIALGPVLRNQQFPRLPGKESNQKSVPLGATVPSGASPITLS